jgi:hypothetical protein
MKGGAKVIIEAHRHAGVFIARGKEDALVTKNLNPGKAVYGEKLIKVDVSTAGWGAGQGFGEGAARSAAERGAQSWRKRVFPLGRG